MDELEEIITELKKIVPQESEYFGKVYDCFIYSINLYIVMEYFESGSLMDAVAWFQADHEKKDEQRVRMYHDGLPLDQIRQPLPFKRHAHQRYQAFSPLCHCRRKSENVQFLDEPDLPEENHSQQECI